MVLTREQVEHILDRVDEQGLHRWEIMLPLMHVHSLLDHDAAIRAQLTDVTAQRDRMATEITRLRETLQYYAAPWRTL